MTRLLAMGWRSVGNAGRRGCVRLDYDRIRERESRGELDWIAEYKSLSILTGGVCKERSKKIKNKIKEKGHGILPFPLENPLSAHLE